MRRVFLLIITLLLLPGTRGHAQLSLEECQARARANYPLDRQRDLIEQERAIDLRDANKGYLPRLSLAARATYQSDVTRLPVSLPGVNIDELSRDQYQAVAEVNQVLWDGGHISAVKKMTEASSATRQRQADVDLHALRERVNQLFFGILLAEEQSRQHTLLREELQRTHERVSAYVARGIARAPDLDAVRVEQVQAAQREAETLATRDAARAMLGILVGEEIGELIKPSARVGGISPAGANRPELLLFQAQRDHATTQLGLLHAKNRPRVGLFAQGGYGNPGLNMLKPSFTAYYLGGIRLSWDLGNLYTLRGERRQVALRQEMVESRRETFLVNLSVETARARAEIEKWHALLEQDDEIVVLREKIAESAGAGVQGGVASVLDWMREVNRLDQARQARALHEIQWLSAIYALKQTLGE
ncbi:MAG: TolC family protein [Odoribacteraceae bacterium]|jgi:outer membrane protein TolC|nr:TolC family protein [Odoribacteraceae bacterium]